MSPRALRAAALWAAWRAQGRATSQRIDAMPPRQRGALALLVVAALAAAELMWVLPARDRRVTVVQAMAAEQRATEDAEQARRGQETQEQSALEARLAAVEVELRRRGAGSVRSESLGLWMQRALAGQAVRVVALRDLGIVEIDTNAATAENAGDAAAPVVSAATAAADPSTAAHGATPQAQPPLFRHRYELTLAGDVNELATAMQTLAERMLPLRIERVRVSSRDGTVIHAALGFFVVTSERTWIAF